MNKNKETNTKKRINLSSKIQIINDYKDGKLTQKEIIKLINS